ncbi:conserved hypothetical protein [Ricinus communis]|uniref:Uncharacterized protein n=1 Tax=Ricinus communis TaxID=3988 RepID=B9SPM1_RICCO|nr:conserved hypothetical protein [Ricinus communis]
MARIPLTTENRTTQKKQKNSISFSDWELDVAQLLLQLSKVYRYDDGGKEYKEEEEKQNDVTSPSCSSTVMDEIYGEDGDEEEDDDGYPKRRIKRFRMIDHVYKSTQPITCYEECGVDG